MLKNSFSPESIWSKYYCVKVVLCKGLQRTPTSIILEPAENHNLYILVVPCVQLIMWRKRSERSCDIPLAAPLHNYWLGDLTTHRHIDEHIIENHFKYCVSQKIVITSFEVHLQTFLMQWFLFTSCFFYFRNIIYIFASQSITLIIPNLSVSVFSRTCVPPHGHEHWPPSVSLHYCSTLAHQGPVRWGEGKGERGLTSIRASIHSV